MTGSRPVSQRQVRRWEQLVKDRKFPADTGAPAGAPVIAHRPSELPRRSRERVVSSRIKTVQSYLQLYG
jgi:hypothetical protein